MPDLETTPDASPKRLALIALTCAVVSLGILPLVAHALDIEEGGVANVLFLVQVALFLGAIAAGGLALRQRLRRSMP